MLFQVDVLGDLEHGLYVDLAVEELAAVEGRVTTGALGAPGGDVVTNADLDEALLLLLLEAELQALEERVLGLALEEAELPALNDLLLAHCDEVDAELLQLLGVVRVS